MTYLGHVRNGVVELESPTQLPDGTAVELRVLTPLFEEPPITSIDELRGADSGDDDPFGPEFEETLRKGRKEPWREPPMESLE